MVEIKNLLYYTSMCQVALIHLLQFSIILHSTIGIVYITRKNNSTCFNLNIIPEETKEI